MWRNAWRQWRCLIPAVVWYEWRAAAPSVAGVQDRMPVILQETLFGKWLDPNVVSAAEVQAMVNEAQSDFVHHAVTTRLDSAKIDEREFANPA